MGQGTAYHSVFQKEIFPSVYGDKFIGSWGVGNRIFDPETHLMRDRNEFRNIVKLDSFGDEDARDVVRPWIANPSDILPLKYEYVEPKVRIPRYRVVCKLDGIIDRDGYEIQEIKTEKEMAKGAIDPAQGGSPRQRHIEQLQICMWATGIHKARLIYVFKGAMTLSQSIMEFEVSYDAEVVDRLKILALKCVESVKECDEWKLKNSVEDMGEEAFNAARLLFLEKFDRMVECPMKSKGRAQRCPERDGCFPGRGKSK
jgi:hypothetical protein